MSQPPSHPWRQPSELDDLFLYQLACLSRTAGTMVVRLCEGGFGITRRVGHDQPAGRQGAAAALAAGRAGAAG